MPEIPSPHMERRFEVHSQQWRDPVQILSLWHDSGRVDRRLLKFKTTGDWWDVLEASGMTLLVSREHEHLLMAMTVLEGEPYITYLPMPHPSGIAVNPHLNTVHVASTRNPNALGGAAPGHRNHNSA